jgi:hypothetical protein
MSPIKGKNISEYIQMDKQFNCLVFLTHDSSHGSIEETWIESFGQNEQDSEFWAPWLESWQWKIDVFELHDSIHRLNDSSHSSEKIIFVTLWCMTRFMISRMIMIWFMDTKTHTFQIRKSRNSIFQTKPYLNLFTLIFLSLTWFILSWKIFLSRFGPSTQT